MYYLEDFFLETETDLYDFFKNNKPTKEMACELRSAYYHYLLNDDGDEVGIETLSPLVVAIILKTEPHFLILLSLFIQNAERMLAEKNKLDSTTESNLYHLKQCAIEINYQPIIDILLALQSPIFDGAAFQAQLINAQRQSMRIATGQKAELSLFELRDNRLFKESSIEDNSLSRRPFTM